MSDIYEDKLVDVEMLENQRGGHRKKLSKIQDRKLVVILVIIISFQIIGAIFVGFQKQEYHIDEIYSYNISNSVKAEKFAEADWLMKKWIDGNEFDEFVTVQDGERFNYAASYRNTSLDAHPPLYYWALHTMCSIFPDLFSKWLGIGLNLWLFVVAEVFIFLISRELIHTKMFQLLPVILYGFSLYAVDTITFIRMYMLLTMITMIFVYQSLRLMKESITIKAMIPLCATIYLGAMTQYYFLVFAFWGCLSFSIYLLKNKRFKDMITYDLGALMSVIIMFVSFPYVIKHVTGSETNNIGNEVTKALFDFKLWLIQLYGLAKSAIHRISSVPAISIAIVVFVTIMILVLLLKGYKEKSLNRKFLNTRELIWIFIAFLLSVVTIAKIGGDYVYLRYIYFIIPLMYICVIVIIDYLSINYRKLQIVLMGVALCFAATNFIIGISYKSSAYLEVSTAKETERVTKYKDLDMIMVVSDLERSAELTGNFTKIREFDSVYINELEPILSEHVFEDCIKENGKCVIFVPTDTYWISGYDVENVLEELIGTKELSYSKISNGSLGEYYLVE